MNETECRSYYESFGSPALPSVSSTIAAKLTASHSTGELLSRLDDCLSRLRAGRDTPDDQIAGVDPLDLLLAPLYVDILNTTRSGQEPAHSPSVNSRIRVWLSKRKGRQQDLLLAKRSAPLVPADVLFWPREITHVSIVQSTITAFDNRGLRCQVLTCNPKCFEDSQRAGLKPVYALAAWPMAADAAKSPARHTRQRWLQAVDHAISQTADAGDRLLLRSIRRTIRQKFELAAAAIVNAREALDRFRPGVLVVGNDLTIEGRAACRVAAQRQVPTVAFMHGALANNPLHARHCADRFLVYGPRHRDDLLRRGLTEQQVVVIGAPHLDARRSQSGQLNPRLQAAFDLRPGAPWMLVATSGPGNATSMAHHQRIVEQLGQLAARFPQVPIVIKLHRKDRPENYSALQNTNAAARIAISPYGDPRVPYDIFEWLHGCPLLLTGTSTVAAEAMLMEVPVITMDFCDETHGVDFIDEGATLHCRTGEELQDAVHQVISGSLPPNVKVRAKAYVNSAFYQLDGRAAQRGADIICQLASQTKS